MSNSIDKYQECCLYFTANSLSRYINSLADDAFKITGLSPSYGYLMLLLIEEPGLSQSELCKRMNLKASTITRFIDKLISMHLVDRVQKGRSSFVYATDEGRKIKVLIDKALFNLYEKYCDVLGKEFAIKLTSDLAQANRLLKE